jgi:methylmalonyl-CoA mutase cobalamin-binding subunit
MATRPKHAEPRPAPRLYLVTPRVDDAGAFAAPLKAALAAGDVAAVLLRLADGDERTLINRAKALAPAVQDAGAALILDGHSDLVARAGADGAHLTGIADFAEALATLKPERIAGIGGLDTRHDAMLAAEQGADYVMFGEPDADGHRLDASAGERPRPLLPRRPSRRRRSRIDTVPWSALVAVRVPVRVGLESGATPKSPGSGGRYSARSLRQRRHPGCTNRRVSGERTR